MYACTILTIFAFTEISSRTTRHIRQREKFVKHSDCFASLSWLNAPKLAKGGVT